MTQYDIEFQRADNESPCCFPITSVGDAWLTNRVGEDLYRIRNFGHPLCHIVCGDYDALLARARADGIRVVETGEAA